MITAQRQARPDSGNGPAAGDNLPNLVFIGDVAVECSYHGSALLYRLFQNYPPAKLRIIEGDVQRSVPARRVPDILYKQLPIGWQRGLKTRFHSTVSAWLSLGARHRAGLLPALLGDFSPQAVVTVAHGYSWLTAAEYAWRGDLPLHLIIHDDWPGIVRMISPVKQWLGAQFERVYQQATSRLCVSPAMVEEYQHRYAAGGRVLYPSRAAGVTTCSTRPAFFSNARQRPVFAFGGSINTPGYVKALIDLSRALEQHKGALNIYGPLTRAEAVACGLGRSNIQVRGLIPANEFIATMRAQADVLFLPLSFAAGDRLNMQLCFPSKLTDYTAAGLPLLIYGPAHSSAVRWARENDPVAEIVVDASGNALCRAVTRLQAASHRQQLGAAALRV